MAVVRDALARLPSLPSLRKTAFAYEELPSYDYSSHNGTPNGSPNGSTHKRKGAMSPARRRLVKIIRTSPRRIFVIALAIVATFVVLIGGTIKARRHYIQNKEDERIPYPWESYPTFSGFFHGLRSLVKYSDWVPQQQGELDANYEVHDEIPFDPVLVDPYPSYGSESYLKDNHPVQHCYVDEREKFHAPDIYAYPGVPAGMVAPYWGSYENLGIAPDRCFERFGRFAPYGYSYPPSEGGLGLANNSAHMGAEKVHKMFRPIDYREVNWGKAQKTCVEKNKRRFEPESKSAHQSDRKKRVKRTAFVLRTWTGYEYSDIQLLTMRAMINELALKSGGEYDIHLLVHVKDDTIPIWASKQVYNETIRNNVPEEFWDMATLWSEALMRTYYPGPFLDEDNFENDSKQPVHGVYRGAHMAFQWFAQQHPEYDFYWNWEMDLRYSGHYYEFLENVSKWAMDQPRKFLWERSARFWIPGIHGSWPSFSQMVERETLESDEKPIWGPAKFETGKYGMLPSPNATRPPHKLEEDNYEWGVGEDADLVTFDPLFNAEKSNWVFRKDVTGYDTTVDVPPRRVAIITVSRMSKRLMNTLHEETFRMHHSMFPEMWPPSIALHHGYKAVYAPHPVYFDRKWPLGVMNQVFNYPVTVDEGPFGGGEHNMQGGSFYYNAGFSGSLWRRWLGAIENGEGGKKYEESRSERMCMRPMLHHPVKFEHVE